MGTPVTPIEGNVFTNFGFLPFVFDLVDSTGQTHRQTDGQDP